MKTHSAKNYSREKKMENSSQTHAQTIDVMKKISLTYTAGTSPNTRDLIETSRKMDFIFGIGTEGLTGFEYALAGKGLGDAGYIEVTPSTFDETFGHIISKNDMFQRGGIDPVRFYLQYTIDGISDTSPGEVVKSMAAAVGGGCDGGCGCGCGSH
jgi:hypothetical protein